MTGLVLLRRRLSDVLALIDNLEVLTTRFRHEFYISTDEENFDVDSIHLRLNVALIALHRRRMSYEKQIRYKRGGSDG